MPPFVALLLWLLLVGWLLWRDPAAVKAEKLSPALWLPLVWLAIMGSRGPSQWFGETTTSSVAAALEEGSALDRSLFLLLIVLALGVLTARSFKWREAVASNIALTLFIAFAFLSIIWSDFPFVSLKRWVRDLGNYLMALVILSDPRPLEALAAVIRRLAYVLISLSVILIKYYRHLAVMYNPWTGDGEYVGVATSKNMLGVLCLISGLFCFWDILRRWPNRRDPATKRALLVNLALLAATLWLLHLSQSATSRACLVIGCLIIAVAHRDWSRTHPRRLAVLIPLALAVFVVLESVSDLSNMVADFLGRDQTLSGRTEIWTVLLDAKTNPIFGAGYESFWLGDRILAVPASIGLAGMLNQAHNGYLEMYLNLGLLGLCLLGGFLIASYRIACRRLTHSPHFASLSLALWTSLVVYNATEAAFKTHLIWCVFLLVGIALPRSTVEVPSPRRQIVVKQRRTDHHQKAR